MSIVLIIFIVGAVLSIGVKVHRMRGGARSSSGIAREGRPQCLVLVPYMIRLPQTGWR